MASARISRKRLSSIPQSMFGSITCRKFPNPYYVLLSGGKEKLDELLDAAQLNHAELCGTLSERMRDRDARLAPGPAVESSGGALQYADALSGDLSNVLDATQHIRLIVQTYEDHVRDNDASPDCENRGGGRLMSCDQHGRVRCDGCGKYHQYDSKRTTFVPDTEFTSELVEHFCPGCWQHVTAGGGSR